MFPLCFYPFFLYIILLNTIAICTIKMYYRAVNIFTQNPKMLPIIFRVKPKFSNNLVFTPYHTSDLLLILFTPGSNIRHTPQLEYALVATPASISLSLEAACFISPSPSTCAQMRPILITLFKTGTLPAKLVFLTLLYVFISLCFSKT